MEMGELVTYYLLPISMIGWNFNKSSSILNKISNIENQGISVFQAQKIPLKKSIKFVEIYTIL